MTRFSDVRRRTALRIARSCARLRDALRVVVMRVLAARVIAARFLAMRVVAMLFIAGFAYGRVIHRSPLAIAVSMVFIGLVIVTFTIALGG